MKHREKHSKRKHRFPIREIRIEIHELSRRTHLTLLGYMILIALMENFVLFPLGRKLWNLSLKSSPDKFISNGNFSTILKSPLVVVCAVFLVFSYCFLTLWETSGLILSIEYRYRDRLINPLKLLGISLRRILHLLHPRNWLIIPFVLLFSFNFNVFQTNEVLSRFQIPEYIQDFINSKPLLLVIYSLLGLALYIVFLHLIFVFYYLIVYRMDFRQAVHQAREDIRGKEASTYRTQIYMLARMCLRLFIVPAIILIGLSMAVVILTDQQTGSYLAFRIVYMRILPSLRSLIEIFVQIELLTIFTVLFHRLQKPEIVEKYHLPLEEGYFREKSRNKERLYQDIGFLSAYMLPIISVLISTGLAVVYMALLLVIRFEPDVMMEFMNQTQVIAHKGYSSMAPENTIPSFTMAADTGKVTFIELDVRETKDGQIVVIHDESLLAAAGVNRSVYDMTYDEILQLNALYGFRGNTAWYDHFVHIPTLEEVYEELGDQAAFLVELKTSPRSPDLAPKTVDIMERYGRVNTDMIHSTNYSALRDVKELNPDIRTGLIIAVGAGVYYDLPDVDFYSVEHTFLTSRTIVAMHNLDKQVYSWTINNTNTMENMIALGVDGIITDKPETAYNTIHTYDDDLMEIIAENIESTFDLTEDDEAEEETPADDY